ncbi:MAG: hypothetical protein WCD08_01355 [Steroidobacteraceae bacterium]
MNTKVVLGAVLTVLVAGLGVPDTARASTIYACMLRATGTIRLVSQSTTCTRLESPLNWDTAGPAGPAGPTGPQGPAGLTAGISAAFWGQLRITKTTDAPFTETCEVPFQRGGTMTGQWTGNDEECRIHVTPDDNLSWGTAYICYTSIFSGSGSPASMVAQVSSSFEAANNGFPVVQLDARDSSQRLLPVGDIIDVGFVCLR